MFALLLVASVLSGAVHSPDGKPVSHATVVVVDHPSTTAVTDDAGNFTINDVTLPADIDVSATGFATARVSAKTSPATITLTPLAVTESVVVFGNAAPAWRDATTGTTTLSREDLDRVPAMTADESLRVVSGFSLFRRSSSRASNPTTHGVTMRGLSASGSSRALILLDGVPLNEGFGGWVTWERLPGAAIDQVSVQRGPAGDVFGSDALGGVIRLVTFSGAKASASATGELASLNTRTLGISGGAPVHGANVFGAASWFDSDGFIPLEPASQGVVDSAMDTTWTNAYGRAAVGSAAQRFTFSGWGGRDNRGNGTVLQRNRSHGGTGTGAFEGVFGKTTFAARVSDGTNWYEQTFSSIVATRATEKLTSTQQIDTDMFHAIAEVGQSLPRGQVTVRAGLSRVSSAFTTIPPPTTSSALPTVRDLRDDNQSVSAQAAVAPIPALTLSAGLRHEWREAPVTDSDAKGATVGRGSASWRVNDVVSLRAAAASSHRWPTLNELARDFAAGSTTTQANPDLLPERARSIEAGIDFSAHRQQLTVTVFRSVVHDAIANVTTSTVGSTIIRQRRNAGDAESAGVEIDSELRASMFRLRASMTFLDAHFRNSQEAALEGNWLPQVPKASIAITGDVLLPHQHVASIVIHNTSSQFDDDRNQFQLAAATQVDLRFAAKWKVIGWQLSIENVGDARLETGKTPLVALAQGRAVRFGLTLSSR